MGQRKRRRRQFSTIAPIHDAAIRCSARALAAGDRDLQDDLVQEGLLAIWKLDPAVLSRARNPRQYVYRTIVRAQLMFCRQNDRHVGRCVSMNISLPRGA
ncbi:MAG: sigma factor [Gemmatimonadaceae bacterium]